MGKKKCGYRPVSAGSWPEDVEEVLRHLSSLEIDLDQYDMEVECILPMVGSKFGALSTTLSRTLDLDEHPEVLRAVETLVKTVRASMRKQDPEYQPDRCDRCVDSDCCHFERIFLTKAEAENILEHLGEGKDKLSRYFKRDKDLGGHYDYVFKHEDGHCTFLKRKGELMRCTIYDVRPRVCREYDAAVCDECENELEE